MNRTFRNAIIIFCINITLVNSLKFEFNPDLGLSITEAITKHGYKVETHNVVTVDGYIITIYRIPSRHNATFPNSHPVMIVPGTCGCSENFLVAGPDKGIAYYLVNRGFDVWLMNTRGNRHARKHVSFNPDRDERFWDFSWHEVAVYDTPALIDYVLQQTGKDDLFYIGHSQGTTSFLAFAAENVDYNKKIRVSVQMAPSCFLNDTRTVVKILGKQSRFLEDLARILHFQEVFPKRWNDYLNTIVKILCAETSILADICMAILYFGQVSQEMEYVTPQIVFETSPAGCSVKELLHYFQIVQSGEFRNYDYGANENMRRYGSKTPPEYNLSQISSPVALFYAPSDNLVPIKGVQRLLKVLPNLAQDYEVSDENFNHVDFIFGKSLVKLVNEPLYKLFNKYL